jgi:hypothetical protein
MNFSTNCEKEQQLLELLQANHELIKEKGILRSLPHRKTYSTMTSPSYICPSTDPASGMSWWAII